MQPMKIFKLICLLSFAILLNNNAISQSRDIPIPKEIPDIPIIEGNRGYREVFSLEDTTKNYYQEIQLFLTNYYKSAKDVVDLNIDLNDQSTGVIVAKAKLLVPTYGFNVQGKKYFQNLTNYTVDHQVTFEIKGNRVRATMNNFFVQEPPLDYTDFMGNSSRIDYPKRTIQEMIDFTQLTFIDSSLEGRINIAKKYGYSDFLNSFDLICKTYLLSLEDYLKQKKDDW
jgi:hypothetical protein